MKKTLLYIMIVCLSAPVSFGADTYTITEYQLLPNLYGTESMLITGNGGGGTTYLSDDSSLIIKSTSNLYQGTGGVWEIQLGYSSYLEMSGGQVNMIGIGNDATALLMGGTINGLFNYQYVTPSTGPHITIVYSGALPAVQNINGYPVLVGNWGDGRAFSIYLPNISGYSPAIDNIRFELIPEPATLVLLGLGTLLLKRRTS